MASTRQTPLFADLVFNEQGERAEATTIGGTPFYAIPEDDFLRHIEASHVDRQIVGLLQERIRAMEDAVTEGVVRLLGEEDLFTRASVQHAIDRIDHILQPGAVDRDQLRATLWMTGFKAFVDHHGDLLHIDVTGWEEIEVS